MDQSLPRAAHRCGAHDGLREAEIRFLPPFCAENGIELHPFRFTAEEAMQPIHNSAFDPHANALGNEFMWRKVVAILEAKNLPPR